MPLNPKTKQTVLKLIDSLIAEGEALVGTKWRQDQMGDFQILNPKTYVDLSAYHQWHASCTTLVQMLGKAGTHWAGTLSKSGNSLAIVESKLGLLKGMRKNIDADLLVTIDDLIRAELFDDLLEQAEHLFGQKYFLAAGVLGRAVLEEHLRNWCVKANVVPAKQKPTLADFYQELYRSNTISKIDLKHIESMAAVGNDAAHNSPTLQSTDVERLLRDVRDFLTKNPV